MIFNHELDAKNFIIIVTNERDDGSEEEKLLVPSGFVVNRNQRTRKVANLHTKRIPNVVVYEWEKMGEKKEEERNIKYEKNSRAEKLKATNV